MKGLQLGAAGYVYATTPKPLSEEMEVPLRPPGLGGKISAPSPTPPPPSA